MRRAWGLVAVLALAGCGAASPTAESPAPTPATSTAPAASTTPAPVSPSVATPTSRLIETTGDYTADLAAHGIAPDDVDDYRAFMAERVCESPLAGDSIPYEGRIAMLIIGQPDAQAAADSVRLTAAYDCPTRSEVAEVAIGQALQ